MSVFFSNSDHAAVQTSTASGDELGDRMKGYEAVETGRKLFTSLPIYARIDGRSFSKFTRGMRRPFDERMSRAMIETTKTLVAETHAKVGYVQSDEISLVWLADTPEASIFFDGKVQKMASVLSGIATAAFMHHLATHPERSFAEFARKLPHFDARVCQIPSTTEATNMFLWRALDATKNAISMAARSEYSARDLHGKGRETMKQMLAAKAIDFEAYPAFFRNGTFVRREVIDKVVDVSDNPHFDRAVGTVNEEGAFTVRRSVVREIEMPPFLSVKNREAVIFEGAFPLL